MYTIVEYIFMASLAGGVVWTLAAIIIGGLLNFNIAHFLESYVSDVKPEIYKLATDNMLIVSTKMRDADLGSWSDTLGSILIVIGIIILAFAASGVVAVILHSSSAQFVTIGLVLLAFILEFVFLWLLVDIDNSFHEDAKNFLVKCIEDLYRYGEGTNDFTKFFNAIMIKGECCGSRGPDDFLNVTVQINFMDVDIELTPACCTKDVWTKPEFLNPRVLNTCKSMNMYNREGCYDTVFNHVRDTSGFLIMAVLSLLMLWEAAVGGLSVFLLFATDADDERRREAKKAVDEEVEEVKEFKPYTKMSSFQSEDVNRIRSTEVW